MKRLGLLTLALLALLFPAAALADVPAVSLHPGDRLNLECMTSDQPANAFDFRYDLQLFVGDESRAVYHRGRRWAVVSIPRLVVHNIGRGVVVVGLPEGCY